MSKESMEMLDAEAWKLWRARYPNRSDKTYTAVKQSFAFYAQAKQNLRERGVVLA